ncbi:MAG: DM13 domain-containing protein [Candidatus Nitrosotenuis sp.]
MNKKAIIAIIIAGVIVPFAAYAIGPYFTNTTIDEPLPSSAVQTKAMEEKKAMEAKAMEEDKSTIENSSLSSGSFVGADSTHNVEGNALVIPTNDGKSILRLEEFKSTNGPDLYVYLATDTDASQFVSLGRLKANIGNQNYEIPAGTDLSKYDTVLIWCQQFSVLFGSSVLS